EQRRGERARRLVLPAARRLPGLHLSLALRPEHDDRRGNDARPALPRARLPPAPHLALQLLGAPGRGLRQDQPGRAPLPRAVHALRAGLRRADSRPTRLRTLRAARADAAAGRRPGGAGRALQLMITDVNNAYLLACEILERLAAGEPRARSGPSTSPSPGGTRSSGRAPT